MLIRNDAIGLAVMELGKEGNWYDPALLSTREKPAANRETIPDMMLLIQVITIKPFYRRCGWVRPQLGQ